MGGGWELLLGQNQPTSGGEKLMKQDRGLAKLALAAIVIALSATDWGVAQTENAPPARRATRPADIRVYRLRTPSSFFEQDAVHFEGAHVDLSGSFGADGHVFRACE